MLLKGNHSLFSNWKYVELLQPTLPYSFSPPIWPARVLLSRHFSDYLQINREHKGAHPGNDRGTFSYCQHTSNTNNWRLNHGLDWSLDWIGSKHVNIVSLRDLTGQYTTHCSSTDPFQWIDKINVQVSLCNLTTEWVVCPCFFNFYTDLTRIPTRIIMAKVAL